MASFLFHILRIVSFVRSDYNINTVIQIYEWKRYELQGEKEGGEANFSQKHSNNYT